MADTLRKFGKFFLLDLLAQGGMAEIYRARHATPTGGGRLLAMKRIQASSSSNPEFISMFRAETKVTSGFTHPNIVQVYDYGEEQGQLYIAMEYVDGRNLRQYISRLGEMKALFPVEVSAYVMEQAAQALQYAHDFKDKFSGKSLNIIHRDVSPQNILVSYDGAVKVIDFGIAKAESQSESTRAGVIKGKPSYLSPEQIAGEVLDGRSDIFALGAVFWELLTGRKLFAGDNDLAVIRMIENCQNYIKPPSLFNPKVPKELDILLLKALEKDKNKRFQSCGEMQRAIHRFLYQFAPEFNPADLSFYAKDLFKAEILEDRKRLQKLNEKAEQLLLSGGGEESENGSQNQQSTKVMAPVPASPRDTGAPPPPPPEVPSHATASDVDLSSLEPLELGQDGLRAVEDRTDPDLGSTVKRSEAVQKSSRQVAGAPPKGITAKPKQEEFEKRKAPSMGAAPARLTNQSRGGVGHTNPGVSSQHAGTRSQLTRGTRTQSQMIHREVTSDSSSPSGLWSLARVAVLALGIGFGGIYGYQTFLAQRGHEVLEGRREVAAVDGKGHSSSESSRSQSERSENRPDESILNNKTLNLLLKVHPPGGGLQLRINGNQIAWDGHGVTVPLDQPLDLSIDKSGYETFTKTFVFESARFQGVREVEQEVELTPSHSGFLSISTVPSAEAVIFIDGAEERLQTPFSGKRLPVGKYKVRLENRILQMQKDIEVQIEENKVKKIDERLNAKGAES